MPKDIRRLVAQEAARARKIDDASVPYVRRGRPPKPARERAQVYTVRIPVEQIEKLRKVAASRDKQPTPLMREWVLDRLSQETAGARVIRSGPKKSSSARAQVSAKRLRS
jgi:hypothetical protein